jgi:hypothetical protein
MQNGDVLGLALEGRIVRIEPLERELAVLDPLDGGEQKPSNSRFSFQYAARTLAPTRNASQGWGALVSSGRSVANGAGWGKFLVCSDADVVVVAAALSGWDGSGAPAPLRTCSPIRR